MAHLNRSIDLQEVREAIRKFKTGKENGTDAILADMLKALLFDNSVCVCARARARVRVPACMFVCMFVCVWCVCARVCVCVCVWSRACGIVFLCV